MTNVPFQKGSLPDLKTVPETLSPKDILSFVRSMYAGEVGPEDVLEAACLIDAWQGGRLAVRLEPVRDENDLERLEKTAFSLSDLRVVVAVRGDDEREVLDSERADTGAQVAFLERTISKLKTDVQVQQSQKHSLEERLHKKTALLMKTQQCLHKRTTLMFCFAAIAALEAGAYLAWAFL